MTARRLLAVVAIIGSLAACGTPRGRILPAPSSTSSVPAAPTTARIDYSGVGLAALPGETTTSVPISIGTSEIRGGVSGPTGLIPGAVVRFERLVGDVVQRTDVTTGADGRYSLADVPGGRYRVRAYLAPLLAMDGPEVFYLADGDTKDLDLRTREFTGYVVSSGVTPGAPFIGQGVNLVVRVTERVVDGDGIGREVGVANASVNVNTTGWTPVVPGAIRLTDANGNVVFDYSCDTVTNVTATAIVDIGTGVGGYPLEVPPCGPRPTTTTTTTTSTTVPDGTAGSSTTGATTTTAP